MQHDPVRLGRRLMKNSDQGFDDKFHARIIIVMHQDREHRRFLDTGTTSDIGTGLVVGGRPCHLFTLNSIDIHQA
jgi:hypothetical protein